MAIQLVSDTLVNPAQPGKVPLEQQPLSLASLEHTLQLAGLLQTTLETGNILDYFLDAAHLKVPFDGAHYVYPSLELDIRYGTEKPHRFSYNLVLANETLGKIEFSRATRFSPQEIQDMEQLLAQLVYPLRNSLWYKQALLSSQRDPLTGVFNRAVMDELVTREIELASRNQNPLSLILLDVDHFKSINDTHGHVCGDQVLKLLVECINASLRKTDTLFRYGGEEFTILLNYTHMQAAASVAERIRQKIEQHVFNYQQSIVPVTVSLGVASMTGNDSVTALLNRADTALYSAKQHGRNQVVTADISC